MVKKIALLGFLFLLTLPIHVMALDLNPGKYEITMSIEMSGMPAGMPSAMPAHTITQCITKQDPIPMDTSGESENCKFSQMKTSGNSVTYIMECQQNGMTVKSTGTMTYSGNTFKGVSETNMGPSAGGMVIKTIINGKRVGPCS